MSETLFLAPGDPGWDEARQAWNLAVDQHPAAIARPACAQDVVAAVQFARTHGLRVAAQGTGHNAGPLGALADTMLVKTTAMRRVSIDPGAKIARAEAGAVWRDVVQAAAGYGLAALGGLLAASLPAEATQTFLGAAGPEADTPPLWAELLRIGGELKRPRPDSGALAALDAEKGHRPQTPAEPVRASRHGRPR